jgi:hypothetical protein
MQGFAYMLVQHKVQLGNMYVSKIQVFRCETVHRNPCIIAHVSQPEAAPEAHSIGVGRRDESHNMVRTHRIFLKL